MKLNGLALRCRLLAHSTYYNQSCLRLQTFTGLFFILRPQHMQDSFPLICNGSHGWTPCVLMFLLHIQYMSLFYDRDSDDTYQKAFATDLQDTEWTLHSDKIIVVHGE